ncbi:hypothetical protein [Deinococcus budaensis]|uniref:Na+/H+-translocating membrane pyrophosphatase n=1 Tax=Deinococcus budaensis TaxID=1665626 RepID=A0A7W8GI20_9DEIO|nr:hypothetical protein [Deinococcus budaensis]MBB5235995.1 Na+/H+-translocating membrane pyrophosphatase [Deinococcus budaensis]
MRVVWFFVGALSAVAKAAVWIMDTTERNNRELQGFMPRYDRDGNDEE